VALVRKIDLVGWKEKLKPDFVGNSMALSAKRLVGPNELTR
jgi:hypothetical protein